MSRPASPRRAVYIRSGSYDEEAGHVHGLHTPVFDFDEDLLVVGTRVLSFLIMKLLSANLFLGKKEGTSTAKG
jgi:metal-dependent amidase/aminoacylase/carboxypeptidase family protein